MSKLLLLISPRPDDLEFVTEIASVTGLSLKHTSSPLEGCQIIASEEIGVIFVDASTEEIYRQFETCLQEAIGLFSDKIDANAIHFLSSSDLEQAKYLVQSPLFGHFVLRNYGSPKEAGQYYGRIVKATISDQAFGIGKLLKPGCKIQVVKLTLSSQKQDAVEAVKSYLIAGKFQTRMATVIANAVDELLMNAIFDAPVDDVGKSTLAATPRSTVFKLEGKHAVEMHIGFDGTYVAISAVDSFGSLDKVKLLSHISKIYVNEEYKVKTTVAGAGIGLATVFRAGGSFFFVSETRVRTEVTVLFRKTDSFRDFKDQFRFISTQFYF